MKQLDVITAALSDFFSLREELDGTRVTTQCLYPSNSFVQVLVRGGENTFYVSDEGGAFREIESAGAEILNADKLLSQLVHSAGLSLRNGTIHSPKCEISELAFNIALVANVSKTASEWLFANTKVRSNVNFRSVVSSYLRSTYVGAVQQDTVVGDSNKPHKFDNIIIFPNGRRLIVDPVIHDHSSINARVVANLDVKTTRIPGMDQRIIYDDREEWRAEDLNLLQVGAPVIAFSNAPEVLRRLANAS